MSGGGIFRKLFKKEETQTIGRMEEQDIYLFEPNKYVEDFDRSDDENYELRGGKFVQIKGQVNAAPITKKSRKKMKEDIKKAEQEVKRDPLYKRQPHAIINGEYFFLGSEIEKDEKLDNLVDAMETDDFKEIDKINEQ